MENIKYFDCTRCQRPHYAGHLLFDLHIPFQDQDRMKEMPAANMPEPGHVLWIANVEDRENADVSRMVVLNLVTANEPGYMPLAALIMPLGDARKYRDEYHARLGLTDAQVEAIEASSMFHENGVRYPANLHHYTKRGGAA